jgi:CheY-like chemotaxis protein
MTDAVKKGPTILLADNNEDYLRTAEEFLRNEGYDVVCASDPAKARKDLEEKPIAIAFLDYRLKDDNERDEAGLKLAEETMHTFTTPKVIMTQYDELDYVRKALRQQKGGRSAAIDFFIKREGLESMLQMIREILTRAKVFLCYAHADREPVVDLYNRLETCGFIPWMDSERIYGGEPWEKVIRRAIETTDIFIVCLSSNSILRRGIIQFEINSAIEVYKQRLPEDIFIMPLRLEDVRIDDDRLKEFNWIDLFVKDGFQRVARSIEEGVRRLR